MEKENRKSNVQSHEVVNAIGTIGEKRACIRRQELGKEVSASKRIRKGSKCLIKVT